MELREFEKNQCMTFVKRTALGAVCLMSMISLFGCGKIEVMQNWDTVELGEKIQLEELVSYDAKKVKKVVVSNDGGFNTKELGDYSVVYTATTNKGKSEEFTYAISVIDTVAPQLKINKTEYHIAMGMEFDIKSFATVTDKDPNTEITLNGDFDINKEGEYVVSYVASDSSGNQSEPVEVKIFVSDRSGADFRNAFFGDDVETIKLYETKTFDSINSTQDTLIFTGENIGGVSCHIVYLLNDEGEMFSAFYSNEDKSGLQCIEDYNTWIDLLEQKYGEPDTQVVNQLSSSAAYCADDGQALELGFLQYWTEYEKDNMIISCYADSDNFEAYTILRYQSKTVSDSTDTDGI